jgi:S1-C subfamily serine protease
MGRLGIGAIVLALAMPCYPRAEPLEPLLRLHIPGPTVVEGTIGGANTALRFVPDPESARLARRFSDVLKDLRPDSPSTTRGAAESRIYKEASRGVVLVVTEKALGSGAVVGPNGLIVTSLHVVGDAAAVGVVFKPKIEGSAVTKADIHMARVVRRDEVADLALLVVSDTPADVPVLKLGNSADVEVGSDVYAIGHPTGETWTYTRGMVSQIRRNYSWTAEDNLSHTADVIQTQTPINPGNSGGPLLDERLNVVGINAFKSSGEGLNFAVSGEDVQAFLKRANDRMTPRQVQTQAPAVDCKWKTISQLRSTDPPGRLDGIDGNCSGKVTFVILTPDDASQPIYFLFDTKGIGKVDTILVSPNRDGNIAFGLYDTVGDGKFHMKGYFRQGDTQPYRYEPISN